MSRPHRNHSLAAHLLTVVKGAFTPHQRPLTILDVLPDPLPTPAAAPTPAGLVPAPRRPHVGPRTRSPRITT